jgi:hypothetical protein
LFFEESEFFELEGALMWKGVLVVMVMIIRWKFGGSTMQKNF